jgi:hypothetical protein
VGGPAWAQTVPGLFKVISAKDEVVIGVAGVDVDGLAKRLVADGQVSAWQYAVHKAANGDLEQAPLRRVAILRQDTVRIEAFASPLKVVPLPP